MLKIPQQFYSASPGSYGKILWMNRKKSKVFNVQWTGCREEFYNDWPRLNQFLFCVPYTRGEQKKHIRKIEKQTIRFMERFQDELGLNDRLEITCTSETGVLYVKMSKFWRDRAARSLLTALLRAGKYYDKRRSFKAAMRKMEYLDETMYAVERFLDGYTCYKPKYFHGWYDTFCDMDKESIDKVLVKP